MEARSVDESAIRKKAAVGDGSGQVRVVML